MKKFAVLAVAAGAVATLVLAPPAQASSITATGPAVVQIASRATPINHDGSVDVVTWVRCRTGIQVFEAVSSVTARDTFGSTSEGPTANLRTCDGTRHRYVVNVVPADGQPRFHNGVATLDVTLFYYDPVEGSDFDVSDTVNVRLFRR